VVLEVLLEVLIVEWVSPTLGDEWE